MANVLIIEPDLVLARTYTSALTRAGHAVQLATTAQEAISLADDVRPDLVLLELQLVAHSGVEFLYEFRSYADWQSVPVAILSTVPPAEFRSCREVLYNQLGVKEYYYKPHTNLKKLVQIVAVLAEPANMTASS
jgi:DNA-binding response OmpR family regulator